MSSETITWTACSERMPDDEITVLMFTPATKGDEVWPGFHDGDGWHCASADQCSHEVTHWAHIPAGPNMTPQSSSMTKKSANEDLFSDLAQEIVERLEREVVGREIDWRDIELIDTVEKLLRDELDDLIIPVTDEERSTGNPYDFPERA